MVKNSPNKELEVSIPPPLGYRDPISTGGGVFTHALLTSHATITFWVIMCWIMRGRRGSGSPRHAVGINSLRVYRNILHHKQVNVGDAWPKAMRFEKPIVVVKQVPAGE